MIELRAAHITLCKRPSDEAKQDSKSGGKEGKAGAEDKAAKAKCSEKDKAAAESTKPVTEASAEAPPMKGEELVRHMQVKVALLCLLCKAIVMLRWNRHTCTVQASLHSSQLNRETEKV